MRINAVDANPNLFDVGDLYSQDLVDKIINTPWMDLPWKPQLNQESWPRRRIDLVDLPWASEWTTQTRKFWFKLSLTIRLPLRAYDPAHTYFWIDQPGFTCGLHTDGTLPGAMQMAWHGNPDLCTYFYQSQQKEFRFRSEFEPNNGYVMVNPRGTFREPGLWHDMPTAVPENQFRVTSYTLIYLLNGSHPI
jgi:hypothetical protein